jgi:hypothetical protein
MRSLGATHGAQFRSVSGRSYFKKRKGEQVLPYHRDGACDRGSGIEDQSSPRASVSGWRQSLQTCIASSAGRFSCGHRGLALPLRRRSIGTTPALSASATVTAARKTNTLPCVNFSPVTNTAAIGMCSFQGLPEDWSGYNLGQRTLDTGGLRPKVSSNVRLYGGWFEDSTRRGLMQILDQRHSFMSIATCTGRPARSLRT